MSHMDMVSLSLVLFFLITILVFSCCSRCEARDSISVSDPSIENGETLVSAGSKFELGFFTPEGNVEGKRYLGIWYSSKLPPKTVVWVAKRETPLLDSCGVLCIADDGNVQVRCGSGDVFPITSLERSENFNRTLQLLDSGNLVLVDGKSDARLWESFNEPTDTFLPGMKMNDGLELTSWISQGDPGKGNFTFRQTEGVYVIHKRLAVHWQSNEPGMFVKQNALPNFVDQMLSDSNGVMDQKSLQPVVVVGKTIPVTPKANCSMQKNCGYFNYNNSRLMMNSSGEIQFFTLVHGGSWDLLWSAPKDYCSVYKQCGYFGICSEKDDQPRCRCPPGYKIASLEDWDAGKYSGGCERVSATCNPNNQTFSNLLLTSVGGQITPYDPAEEEEDCRTECLNDCNCVAYSFRNITVREAQTSDPNCFTWAASDLVFHGDGTSGYHRNTEAGPVFFSDESERHANNLMQENEKLIDVPFYDLESILSATDNFSDANKLGQGGFGPVYKGRFPGGLEIAVKRLSSCSGQGIDEFLNEVVLIAKLQHRNLVRLLGYCIKGSEKILLYEYMPNRSLDAFIFDQHNCLLLDWKKRFDIILGIARGLLYLHQDSRLRIIHRDLKTSNILLDEDMNPKISDFGLARIVEGKGTEASTNKVVGTYGYMSPEYALDGKFSIKSDVFSFGVVMLEIISGRKNTGFYNPNEVLNLLGYAWRLSCDNKALDILHPTLLESSEESEVIKCINIGLLCVQEDPNERPPMSTVVIMLGSETNTLPLPTQPAFVVRRRLSSMSSSSSSAKPDTISVNQLTFSMAQGR